MLLQIGCPAPRTFEGARIRQGAQKKYAADLLCRIGEGDIDPAFVVTHTVPLGRAPEMYKTFWDKLDRCIKVVLKP